MQLCTCTVQQKSVDIHWKYFGFRTHQMSHVTRLLALEEEKHPQYSLLHLNE